MHEELHFRLLRLTNQLDRSTQLIHVVASRQQSFAQQQLGIAAHTQHTEKINSMTCTSAATEYCQVKLTPRQYSRHRFSRRSASCRKAAQGHGTNCCRERKRKRATKNKYGKAKALLLNSENGEKNSGREKWLYGERETSQEKTYRVTTYSVWLVSTLPRARPKPSQPPRRTIRKLNRNNNRHWQCLAQQNWQKTPTKLISEQRQDKTRHNTYRSHK